MSKSHVNKLQHAAKPQASHRMVRVNRLIQETLAEMIPGELSDPRLQRVAVVSVVEVRTSPDLAHATVYVRTTGTQTEQRDAVEALQQFKSVIRAKLARSVELRHTPDLHFVADTQASSAHRVDEILRELAQTNETE